MKKIKRSRIAAKFAELKKKNEKALITFVTAGDPDIKTTRALVLDMERKGADIIELGIPFSDPMADGPTIQASSERAVKGGVRLKDVLGLVSEIRKKSGVPIVLFGYYNPIFIYGVKRFAKDAARAGADGALVVDLPPEEAVELKRELDKEGLDLIHLLTPTSDARRIRLVAKSASGFIYYVSVAGVTGARKNVASDVRARVTALKKKTSLPVGVGFGISSAGQAKEVGAYADGVVVGSAIINIIALSRGSSGLKEKVGRFVGTLKRAIK